MRLNGRNVSLNMDENLYDFLERQEFDITTIAVELNGKITPRDSYKDVILKEEDSIEVVRFVGGG